MGSQEYKCHYCDRTFSNPRARDVHEGSCKERIKQRDASLGSGTPKETPKSAPKSSKHQGPSKDAYLGRSKGNPQGQPKSVPGEDEEEYGCANCQKPVKYRQAYCPHCGVQLNWEGV